VCTGFLPPDSARSVTEEPLWEIPIVDGDVQTGSVVFYEDEVVIRDRSEHPYLVPPPVVARVTDVFVYSDPPLQLKEEAKEPEIDVSAAKELLESVPLTFEVSEAREKGRKIYEKAVEMADREGIPLKDALEAVGSAYI
jgi:hypothetical protein